MSPTVTSEIPKIALQGVKKSFGKKTVLDGIDLSIDKGESVVIIGGSGSGKSVTIKCILGILRASAGKSDRRRRRCDAYRRR